MVKPQFYNSIWLSIINCILYTELAKKYFYNIIDYENIKNILRKIIFKEKFYNLSNIYYVWFGINIGTLSFLSSLTYIAIYIANKKKKNTEFMLYELIYIELDKNRFALFYKFTWNIYFFIIFSIIKSIYLNIIQNLIDMISQIYD